MGSLQTVETLENRDFRPYTTATQKPVAIYSSGQSLSADTHWINEEQAAWTIGCYYAALAEGYPINAMITVAWEAAELRRNVWTCQNSLIASARKWLTKRRIPAVYIWVKENGPIKGKHTHLALHLPKQHRRAFRSAVHGWVKSMGGKSHYEGALHLSKDRFSAQDPELSTINLLDYMLKGSENDVADKYGFKPMHRKAGSVQGQRIGQSQHLRKTARRIAIEGPEKPQERQLASWTGKTLLNEHVALWGAKTASSIKDYVGKTRCNGMDDKPRPVNVGGRQSRNAGWLAKGDEVQRYMMAELADYELSLGRRLVEREAVDFLNSHRGKPCEIVTADGEVIVQYKRSARDGLWARKSYRTARKRFAESFYFSTNMATKGTPRLPQGHNKITTRSYQDCIKVSGAAVMTHSKVIARSEVRL